MRAYKSRQIGDLARQLSIGLLRLRAGYIDAAEGLLGIIEDTEEYPHDFVVFRLTGYRPSSPSPGDPLSGATLRKDLSTLILDLCDSFDCTVGQHDEAIYDTEALAKFFNVATKTIQRWRQHGLVARRMIFPNGKRRIAFTQRSVDAFIAKRPKQVERSSRFTQLSPIERNDMIRRARRMATVTHCCLHDVSRRIAAKTGRAVETVRYTIRDYDKRHPDNAIFSKLTHPLDEVTKQVIYRSFLRGVSVPVLAERHKRTRSSVYRVVNEMRARHLLSQEIGYIYNSDFDLPTADDNILAAPMPPAPKPTARAARAPKDLPPYLANLYRVPLLTKDQEQYVFRKYNYLKYKSDNLRKNVDLNHVRMSDVARIESLLMQGNAMKNRIIRANLRLVVSIARKHVSGGPQSLFELISDGNVSLMRAVEKFDYARGYKFSTYASWAIMKNYARSVPRERYRQGRYMTGQEEALDVAAGLATYDSTEESIPEIRESIDAVLAQLSLRERAILVEHYGLMKTGNAATLEELGRELGISKERVRQIEIHALKKLRKLLEPDRVGLMSS